MKTFLTTCCGIQCIVRVLSWESHTAGYISGAPESCYPPEGGYGDWEILDKKGKKAIWLEKKLEKNKKEFSRLENEVFEFMEN